MLCANLQGYHRLTDLLNMMHKGSEIISLSSFSTLVVITSGPGAPFCLVLDSCFLNISSVTSKDPILELHIGVGDGRFSRFSVVNTEVKKPLRMLHIPCESATYSPALLMRGPTCALDLVCLFRWE